ncbi:hypothetical protein Q0Z83_007060 [Actinoplanes sichuanensis]|uniref:DUF6292 family protein n=1 Tax=Actinoplanes sichuanensis TaxID=512349 RepID=A0ABW4AG73_9ACTN|nr:DUF6292 family protein [Actinoplanes sichuanensis]BEL02515.1 hypothetical protein Q0Z83_007060 [Actinoplanes sichuanensis]
MGGTGGFEGIDGTDGMDGSRSAHAAYIRAVAAALEDAGVPVADWRADDGPVRDGWIPFDLARQVRLHGRPVWDHDQAGAGWSEERGWYLLTVDDPAGRDVRTAEALGIAMIAAPGAVARSIAALAGLSVSPPREAATSGPVAASGPAGASGSAATSGPVAASRPAGASGSAATSGPLAASRPVAASGPAGAFGSAGAFFGLPEVDADFPGHRAGVADPAFEAALLRYSARRTKSVDGWRDAAEGRG